MGATEWVVMEDMAWVAIEVALGTITPSLAMAMEDMAWVAMEVALGTLTPSLAMALSLPTVLPLPASLKMASRYLLTANNLLTLFRMAKHNSRRSKHLLDISLSNSMSILNSLIIPSNPSIGTMATLGTKFILNRLPTLLLPSLKCC